MPDKTGDIMKKEIELVAMDIDGTILGKNKTLSERTKTVFQKAAEKGIHLVVASGRAVQAVPEEIRRLQGVEYVISSNGSSIFRLSDGQRIYEKDLTSDQIDALLAFYDGYSCPIEVFIQGHPYTSEAYYHEPEKFGADSLAAEYVRTTRCPVADIRQFIQKHKKEIDGVNFIVYDPELKKEMRSHLESFGGLYVTSSVPRYIEISHGDVCKRNALIWLNGFLGIPREHTVAFGDGENDLEMIQYAGIGVAMGNGTDGLKAAADVIARPCDEDGVARLLEEMLEI